MLTSPIKVVGSMPSRVGTAFAEGLKEEKILLVRSVVTVVIAEQIFQGIEPVRLLTRSVRPVDWPIMQVLNRPHSPPDKRTFTAANRMEPAECFFGSNAGATTLIYANR
jgi:hypothetical protein